MITDIEKIAMVLFGWNRKFVYDENGDSYSEINFPIRVYTFENSNSKNEFQIIDSKTGYGINQNQYWPSFDSIDEHSWHWIRQMEREIERKNYFDQYVQCLLNETSPKTIIKSSPYASHARVMLSDIEQRITAAVYVIDNYITDEDYE